MSPKVRIRLKAVLHRCTARNTVYIYMYMHALEALKHRFSANEMNGQSMSRQATGDGGDSHLAATGSVLCLHPRPPEQVCRTMPGLAEQLTPLDDAVTNCLAPALLGRQVNDTERAMIAQPCRHGGLGLTPPSSVAQQHESSVRVSQALTECIIFYDRTLSWAMPLRASGRQRRRPDPIPGIVLELMLCSSADRCRRTCREPWIWQRKKEPPAGSPTDLFAVTASTSRKESFATLYACGTTGYLPDFRHPVNAGRNSPCPMLCRVP